MPKLGFIGLGNMGSGIINGIIEKQLIPCDQLYVSRKHPELAKSYADLGAHVFADNRSVANNAEIIVLAVKPNILGSVLDEIRDALDHQLIISIAAGWSPKRLESSLPESVSYICAMPNVPVSVGMGCTILNEEGRYKPEEMEETQRIFSAIGKTHLVSSRVYDPCGTLAGCGPAYVFEFMEALCDAAVLAGIPKPLAQSITAEMIAGAAQMALDTGMHPCALKDSVCSPGGTTIEGIRALHEHGFHAGVMAAIASAIEKKSRL